MPSKKQEKLLQLLNQNPKAIAKNQKTKWEVLKTALFDKGWALQSWYEKLIFIWGCACLFLVPILIWMLKVRMNG